MTLWQRIKSWFGFKPKQKDVDDDYQPTELRKNQFAEAFFNSDTPKDVPEVRGVILRDSKVPPVARQTAGKGFTETRSTPPVRSTPVRSYGESELSQAGSALYHRNDNSFLDGVVTAMAVDAVIDMVSDAVRSEPVREEPAYVAPEPTPVWRTEQPAFREPEPSYTPPISTTFDDARSSSFDNSGSSNWVSDVVESVSSSWD